MSIEINEPIDGASRKEQMQSRKKLQKLMQTMKWKSIFTRLTEDLSNREFYASFSQTAIEAIRWLEAKLQEKIFDYAIKFQQEITEEFDKDPIKAKGADKVSTEDNGEIILPAYGSSE